MAIINLSPDILTGNNYSYNYPDVFVSKSKRESERYIKDTADFFTDVAIKEYNTNKNTFVHNYEYLKGKLRKSDFYENEEVKGFVDTMLGEESLPDDVVHYSVMNQPINTVMGEQSSRPTNTIVKAFDDDSQSEELSYRTDILEKFVTQKVFQSILSKAVQQGLDVEDQQVQQQLQQMTGEQVQEEITSYTSTAERWANRMLKNLDMEFNIKEMSEEAFHDLIVCARPRLHIFEDKSKLGFSAEVVNPKNTWKLSVEDKKYFKDAHAAGIIEVLELSDIIERYDIPKKEIDHLRDILTNGSIGRPSNVFTGDTGLDSIKYDTYDPLKLQESLLERPDFTGQAESELDRYMGLGDSNNVYGNKFVVATTYYKGKIKIGKLTYINEDGEEVVALVSEEYKKGMHPNEVDIDWGWANQWFKIIKIGNDIYHLEPLRILDRCPIIGVNFQAKNSKVVSFLDQMKPFQVIYDVAVNQLFSLLKKEYGVLYNVNIRKIYTPKDADPEDALQIWEQQARGTGIAFEDDSPENMKTVSGNTNLSRPIDLTRTAEIQSRYNVAGWAKEQAWEIAGMNRQRLGGATASETATGIQSNLSQSYAQTEPYFTQHAYVMQDFKQALLDAAIYIESQKPTSTISYISGEGEHAFVQINGPSLKLKDIRVFITDRAKDSKMLEQVRSLAQPMLQNGASPYEVSQMFITDSTRHLQDIMKRVKNEQDKFKQQQLEVQQQQLKQQQEQAQAELQYRAQEAQVKMQNDNMNKALDRTSKEKTAAISSFRGQPDNLVDENSNGIPDIVDILKDQRENLKIQNQYQTAISKITSDNISAHTKLKQQQEKVDLEKRKLDMQQEENEKDRKLKRDELKSQETIAKQNKNQYDK